MFEQYAERPENSGFKHLLFICACVAPQVLFTVLALASPLFETTGGGRASAALEPLLQPLAILTLLAAVLHWFLTGIALVSSVLLTLRNVELLKKKIAWGAVGSALIADFYIRSMRL